MTCIVIDPQRLPEIIKKKGSASTDHVSLLYKWIFEEEKGVIILGGTLFFKELYKQNSVPIKTQWNVVFKESKHYKSNFLIWDNKSVDQREDEIFKKYQTIYPNMKKEGKDFNLMALLDLSGCVLLYSHDYKACKRVVKYQFKGRKPRYIYLGCINRIELNYNEIEDNRIIDNLDDKRINVNYKNNIKKRY